MQYEYRPLVDNSFYAPQSISVSPPASSVVIHPPSTTSLSQEESVNGEIPKTCARCAMLYKRQDDQVDSCQYHPGTYNEGRLGSWTCCKALSLLAAPCKKTHHIEAKRATADLRRFMELSTNFGTPTSKLDSCMPTDPFPTKARKIRAETTPQDGFVTHVVLPVDTIEGVCLRYDISITELAKYNRGLTASSFPAFRSLLIPVGVDDEIVVEKGVSDEERIKMEHERLTVKFRKMFKVSPEIATSYLSANDYHYEQAATDYEDDLAFEQSSSRGTKAAVHTTRSTKFDPIPSPKQTPKTVSSTRTGNHFSSSGPFCF